MSRRVVILILGLFLFAGIGLVLTFFMKLRNTAEDVRCKNNFRELVQFAANHVAPEPNTPAGKFVGQIPAGTIVLPGVAPEERLSWYVPLLPSLDQKRQNMNTLLSTIDVKQPWSAEQNQEAGRTRLLVALCPGNPALNTAGSPANTNYVGISGRGTDSALLALPLPPAATPVRAGCFRYDSPTPFDAIADGLGQTLLMGERSSDLGPWLRGGPATVRGLDDSPNAPPILGTGGQFGGNHPRGANWAFADGSVRFFTDQANPRIFLSLATIAGREDETVPLD